MSIKKIIKSNFPFIVDILRLGKSILKFLKRIKSSGGMIEQDIMYPEKRTKTKNIFIPKMVKLKWIA